jgi:hypothetical protein
LTKYHRYAASIIDHITSAEARAATLRLRATLLKGDTMQKRKLGDSNLEVPAVGLGCMG